MFMQNKKHFGHRRESCTFVTENGTLTTTEAIVYVAVEDMLITVHILKDSSVVLSPGQFTVEQHFPRFHALRTHSGTNPFCIRSTFFSGHL